MYIRMNIAMSVMRHTVAVMYGSFSTTLPEEHVSNAESTGPTQQERMMKWIRGDDWPIRIQAL